MYIMSDWPCWRRLEVQVALRACSRALANTGNSMAARIAIMAITTRSSMRVKALRLTNFIVLFQNIPEGDCVWIHLVRAARTWVLWIIIRGHWADAARRQGLYVAVQHDVVSESSMPHGLRVVAVACVARLAHQRAA